MSFSYSAPAKVYPGPHSSSMPSGEDGEKAASGAPPIPTPVQKASVGFHIFTNLFYDKGPFMNYAQKKMGIPALVLQILMTVFVVVLAFFAISETVTEQLSQPSTKSGVAVKPSGAEMWSLFKRNAAYQANPAGGGIKDLHCECTDTNTPLGEVLTFNAQEDSFCKWATEKALRGSNARIGELSNIFGARDWCAGDKELFAPRVTQFLLENKVISTKDNFASYDFIAHNIHLALCDFSFGVTSPSYFRANDALQYSTAYTNMSDLCYPRNELEFHDATASSFVLGRDKRSLTFLEGAATTCSSLRNVRTVFESTMRATSRNNATSVSPVFISSTVALEPAALGATAKNLFYASLQEFGARMSSFVPGSSPDVSSPLLEKNADAVYLSWFFSALSQPTTDSYLFSSRLPFSRSDFGPSSWYTNMTEFPPLNRNRPSTRDPGTGGPLFYKHVSNRFFAYLMEPKGGPLDANSVGNLSFFSTPIPMVDDKVFNPVLTGATRLVFTPKAGTLNNYPIYSFTNGTSPSFPGGKNSFVVVGNDYLTLLDACANGEALRMDVYSIHPTAPLPGVKRSSFIPEDYSPRSCALGEAPDPSSPLFTFPVTCPSFLIEMGNARKVSSYFKYSNPFRLSGNDGIRSLGLKNWSSISAALNSGKTLPEPLLSAFNAFLAIPPTGDQLNIQNVLSTLFINMDTLTLNASDPTPHYTKCAPLACTYTEVIPKTIFLQLYEVADKVGAGMSAVLLIFGSFMLMFCYVVFLLYPPKGIDIFDADTLGGPGGGGGGSSGDSSKDGGGSKVEGLLQLEQKVHTLGAELAALKAAAGGVGAAAVVPQGLEGGGGEQQTLRGAALEQHNVERLQREEALQLQVQQQQLQLQQLQAQLESFMQQQQQQQQQQKEQQGQGQGQGVNLQEQSPFPQRHKPAPLPIQSLREEGDSSSSNSSSLPPGWEEVDRGPGQKVYYFHAGTRRTQWERPMVAGGTPTPTRAPPAGATTSPAVLATAATSPAAAAAAAAAAPKSQMGSMVEGAPGWTALRDVDGKTYFYHAATRRTQWEDPRGGMTGGGSLDIFAGGGSPARGGGGGMYLRSPTQQQPWG